MELLVVYSMNADYMTQHRTKSLRSLAKNRTLKVFMLLYKRLLQKIEIYLI